MANMSLAVIVLGERQRRARSVQIPRSLASIHESVAGRGRPRVAAVRIIETGDSGLLAGRLLEELHSLSLRTWDEEAGVALVLDGALLGRFFGVGTGSGAYSA
ncbi:hypothetical protein R3J22_07325 [Trueperella bernardiae]|uniref:hypothetical protein n=1 Tax=Trueperella bernardiae TaxID=59561 RepID=UPI00117C1578|nr:hypothetical protein [Trueperella bernardiae]MDV6239335.1 hypothetical protein [Trueperella bernardiae]